MRLEQDPAGPLALRKAPFRPIHRSVGQVLVQAVAGVALAVAVTVLRARRRGRAAELPQPALGLLTAGLDGSPLLLLGDPRVTPVEFVAVPLETPLPRGTAAAFAASPGPQLWVRGRMRAGELVVAEVAGTGAPLLPRAGALRPGAAVLLGLLEPADAAARPPRHPVTGSRRRVRIRARSRATDGEAGTAGT